MADDDKNNGYDVISPLAGAVVGAAVLSQIPVIIGAGGLMLHEPPAGAEKLAQPNFFVRKWQAFRAMPASIQVGAAFVAGLLGLGVGYAVHAARKSDTPEENGQSR